MDSKRLIAELAGRLKYLDIIKVLIQYKDEKVRRDAVRSIFYSWRAHSSPSSHQARVSQKYNVATDPVINLLKEISEFDIGVRQILLNKIKRLLITSCFELSISILFDAYQFDEISSSLVTIWSRIIRRWFSVHDRLDQSWYKRALNLLFRRIKVEILRTATAIIINQAENFERVNEVLTAKKDVNKAKVQMFNITELKLFFEQSDGVTQRRFRRIMKYINPEKSNLWEIEEDLLAIALSRDFLSLSALCMILVAHLNHPEKSQTTRTLTRRLFEFVLENQHDTCSFSIPFINIAFSGYLDGLTQDELARMPNALALQEDLIVKFHQLFDSLSYGQLETPTYIYNGLSSYPHYAYRCYNKVYYQDELDEADITNPYRGRVIDIFLEKARERGREQDESSPLDTKRILYF